MLVFVTFSIPSTHPVHPKLMREHGQMSGTAPSPGGREEDGAGNLFLRGQVVAETVFFTSHLTGRETEVPGWLHMLSSRQEIELTIQKAGGHLQCQKKVQMENV